MGEVHAQLIPKKLGVSEFTVKYAEYPFTMPDVEYVDPYTGETWINKGYQGVHVAIELVIKNPRGYSDICYNVRYKGHYETSDEAWHQAFTRSEVGGGLNCGFPAQTNSEYTTISFNSSKKPSYIGNGLIDGLDYPSVPVPGGSIDIQVEAMAFYIKTSSTLYGDFPHYMVDERSGWSGTKTLTRPAANNEVPNQFDPTPSPTYTSDQPSQNEISLSGFNFAESGLVVGLCIVIVVLSIALVYKQKTSHKTIPTDT